MGKGVLRQVFTRRVTPYGISFHAPPCDEYSHLVARMDSEEVVISQLLII